MWNNEDVPALIPQGMPPDPANRYNRTTIILSDSVTLTLNCVYIVN